jgi:hypothetical protein
MVTTGDNVDPDNVSVVFIPQADIAEADPERSALRHAFEEFMRSPTRKRKSAILELIDQYFKEGVYSAEAKELGVLVSQHKKEKS